MAADQLLVAIVKQDMAIVKQEIAVERDKIIVLKNGGISKWLIIISLWLTIVINGFLCTTFEKFNFFVFLNFNPASSLKQQI